LSIHFHYFGTRKAEVLNSLIMNIMAKANDTNDILQTFRYLLLSSSVHSNRTAVILLQVFTLITL